MTVEELRDKLGEMPLNAIVCKAENQEYMDKEITEIEYYDNAVYINEKGDTQRGKIVII